MKIHVLGAGSVFASTKQDFNSCLVFESDGKRIMYDCGRNNPEAMEFAGLTVDDIDALCVSHLHSDHAGGVEDFAFKTYFGQFPFGKNKKQMFGHKEVLEKGWDNTWSGGLKSIKDKIIRLENYFDTTYLEDRGIFNLGNMRCLLISTNHYEDNKQPIESNGLLVIDRTTNKTFMVTGDSKFDPEGLHDYYVNADVICQDCELAEYPGSVHVQYHELKALPTEIKSKMWLYHYNLKDGQIELPDAKADGFLGFVKRGDVIEC